VKHSVIRSIINNTFLSNYHVISNYFCENNLDYNYQYQIDGGFTLDFCPSDSKELFEQNLKTQPEDWYYRTNPVRYTLNSSGYRTKEFDDIDWKESIVMFGCSQVFGIGVTDEHTIPYFLEQLSGRPVINMGIGGSSIQTVLHNSIILNDSKYPTPKAVVNMWTDLNRYQLYENNFAINVGTWRNSNDKFRTPDNMIPFNLMNIKMVRNLWKNKTIYYECSGFGQEKIINKLDSIIRCDSLYNRGYYKTRWARDVGDSQHYGSEINFDFARIIYKKLLRVGFHVH
jgi:hypothetical protein